MYIYIYAVKLELRETADAEVINQKQKVGQRGNFAIAIDWKDLLLKIFI